MSLEGALRELRQPITYRRVKQIIKAIRFNGGVTIDFRDGIEKTISIGRPVVLVLEAELDEIEKVVDAELAQADRTADRAARARKR